MNIDLFDGVAKIRRFSPTVANKILERVIPRLIPLAKGLDVKVHQCDDLRCVLSMPLQKKSRNHLGSMYFGAQMTLLDLTAGVILFQRFPIGPFGGVIKRVETEFLKKAKGTIRCVCDLSVETIDQLEQVRHNASGKSEAWVPLDLLDHHDDVVTRARVLVAIKRF